MQQLVDQPQVHLPCEHNHHRRRLQALFLTRLIRAGGAGHAAGAGLLEDR
jgi:hypothetical protein